MSRRRRLPGQIGYPVPAGKVQKATEPGQKRFDAHIRPVIACLLPTAYQIGGGNHHNLIVVPARAVITVARGSLNRATVSRKDYGDVVYPEIWRERQQVIVGDEARHFIFGVFHQEADAIPPKNSTRFRHPGQWHLCTLRTLPSDIKCYADDGLLRK
jgi:hypothetical protein